MKVDETPQARLKAALDYLKGRHGNAVLKPASQVSDHMFRPSGLPSFDALVGGIPVGRIIVISGLESTGKSSFCYKVMAQAQTSLLIDGEGSFTSGWGLRFGLNDENLIVARPTDMEEAYNIVVDTLRSHTLDYIVIDSAASMSARDEMEREADEQGGFAERAILTNALCRRTVALTRKHMGTTVIVVQHLYEDPQAAKRGYQGTAYELSGGRGQRYLCSLHLGFYRAKVLQEIIQGADGENEKRNIGLLNRWSVQKSKVGPDGVSGLFRLFTRRAEDPDVPPIGHMDDAPEFLRLALMTALIEKHGSWYSLGDEKVQGEDRACDMVQAHADELIEPIRRVLATGVYGEQEDEEDE